MRRRLMSFFLLLLQLAMVVGACLVWVHFVLPDSIEMANSHRLFGILKLAQSYWQPIGIGTIILLALWCILSRVQLGKAAFRSELLRFCAVWLVFGVILTVELVFLKRELGSGTIQAELDTAQYAPSVTSARGDLGWYGGSNPEAMALLDEETRIKVEAENLSYSLVVIDNYGPFSYPVIVDSSGEATLSGAEQLFWSVEDKILYSFANYQYDDGYWVVAKQFKLRDMGADAVAVMDTLSVSLQEVDYRNHRMTPFVLGEKALVHKFQKDYSNVLIKVD